MGKACLVLAHCADWHVGIFLGGQDCPPSQGTAEHLASLHLAGADRSSARKIEKLGMEVGGGTC